ncbi:hypothetical protein BDF22DRAFT_743449 [Syncephalis plumigaleata]|nr:hypothetical protein BDF22DRAFT_743449 [Syncephalis plumigaleata]
MIGFYHVLPRLLQTRTRWSIAIGGIRLMCGITSTARCTRQSSVTRLNSRRNQHGMFPISVAVHHYLIGSSVCQRFLSIDRATRVDTTIEDDSHSCGCAQPDTTCPFYILKVSPTTTRHQLKRAYYARCLESHPDTQATHTKKRVVAGNHSSRNTQFIAVQRAYEQACKHSYRNSYNAHNGDGDVQRSLQRHRSKGCPLAVSPACSSRTNGNGSFSSYSAFVRRHAYDPHNAAYRHDAGLDFSQHQPSNGQAHPLRYTTNQRRLNMQASQALKMAHRRAKDLGWEGQKALLEERIANLSK